MKIFECQECRTPIHFHNDQCVACGTPAGYLASAATMIALEQHDAGWVYKQEPSRPAYPCANRAEGVCNWLVEAGDNERFCRACRTNETIPDLSVSGNHDHWQRIELAKRQLIYSIDRFGLPFPDRRVAPGRGLSFRFMADTADNTFPTGYTDGAIAINIAEADDAERERRRTSFGEPYRTLLGHFRHETGHFYWDLLVAATGRIDEFATLFGDGRNDYAAGLQAYYNFGPPADWRDHYISAYATAHPLEDFAETFAHCLHIIDGLETAITHGLWPDRQIADPYREPDFATILAAWVPLSVAVNALNRSLGQPDLYPFVLSEPATAKLAAIHRLIVEAGQATTGFA